MTCWTRFTGMIHERNSHNQFSVGSFTCLYRERRGTVDSKSLECGPSTISAGRPSSQAFGVEGQSYSNFLAFSAYRCGMLPKSWDLELDFLKLRLFPSVLSVSWRGLRSDTEDQTREPRKFKVLPKGKKHWSH